MLARESFPALDAIFLGTIDEYHGSRLSTGVPDLPDGARPELVAFLDHLDTWYEEQQEDQPPPEDDFRTGREEAWATYLAEAEDFARRMMSGDIGWQP